jgi:hypothetical protein
MTMASSPPVGTGPKNGGRAFVDQPGVWYVECEGCDRGKARIRYNIVWSNGRARYVGIQSDSLSESNDSISSYV